MREFAMNSTAGGEYRRSRVPSTRITTASRTRCMYTRFFRVGGSPTRDLQLEQLHREEWLTSFDRDTGPYIDWAGATRDLRGAPGVEVLRHFYAKQSILCTFYFLALRPLPIYYYNYRFAKDVSCEYLITLYYYYTLMIFEFKIFSNYLWFILFLYFKNLYLAINYNFYI